MQIRQRVFGGSLPSLWILREKVKLPAGGKRDEETLSFFLSLYSQLSKQYQKILLLVTNSSPAATSVQRLKQLQWATQAQIFSTRAFLSFQVSL